MLEVVVVLGITVVRAAEVKVHFSVIRGCVGFIAEFAVYY